MTEQARVVKIVARALHGLLRERTRTFQRLRSTLCAYSPDALGAYADLSLTSTDVMERLVKAPTARTDRPLRDAALHPAIPGPTSGHCSSDMMDIILPG
ncbi:hypothetical protein [Streptomyces sp. NPDC002520]